MVDRSIAPKADNITAFSLPEISKRKICGGVETTIVNQGDQPIIILDLIFPVGKVHDKVQHLTYFTSKLLAEGTKTKSSAQIADEIDFYGGYLEITPTIDHVSFRVYALKKLFPEILAILIDILSNPIFPENELNNLKNIRSQQIKQLLSRNSTVASIELRKSLFGETHPYGSPIDPKPIQKISRDLITEHYRHVVLTQPKLFLAGEITSDTIKIVEDTFSNLRFNPIQEGDFPIPNPSENCSVEKPESVQSSIRLGKITLGRHDPDIYSLKVANELLGGFFGSRLMKNIREIKGLTYGIHSSIVHLQHYSYWQISSDILKEKKDEAITEIIKEVEKLQNANPSNEEVETLKNYMKGKLLGSFDNIFNSLELVKSIDLDGISTSYWKRLLETINEATPESISAITKKHFSTDKIAQVVVG